MNERCDLTELLVDQCGHCLGQEPGYERPYQGLRVDWWNVE